jgi:hypothetical protein
VRDGKPEGQGVFNFNPDDIQVNSKHDSDFSNLTSNET